MSCLAYFAGNSLVHRLDPRARLLGALALTVPLALSSRLTTLGWGLGLAVALAVAARLDVRHLARRLMHLNLFVLFLWLVLPWSAPGETAGAVLGIPVTREGIRLAQQITLKGNAIVLLFTALVATIAPLRLAGAFKRLGLPDVLVHLLSLVVRYTDTIHEEYHRLRRAMRTRAFRPSYSPHTLRALGYLVGLLLVRSIERGERVLAAMKCRGFDGRFRVLEGFAFRAGDVGFGAVALCHAAAWIWMEAA